MKTTFRHDEPRDLEETMAGEKHLLPPLAFKPRTTSGCAAMALSRALFFGLLAAGVVSPVRACTTFDLIGNGNIVYGRNFDYYAADGRVMVNRRGLKKTAFWTNSGLQWVSRFGSLTFNQFGFEFPNGGINEAGLVVEHMMLEGSQYPSDSRPSLTELQWIQYQLDCSASVADVLGSDQRVRIDPNSTPLHFLVADRTGRCATVEFLGGQMVYHTGSSLPVAALTNDTYDSSLAYAAITSPGQADHVSSLGRFVQADASVRNFTQSNVADPIAYAFAALDNVNQPNWTRWSIVYDIGNMSVYFRTQPVPLVKEIRVAGLDFRPSAPILMMDINANASGLVAPQSIYSAADNLAVLRSVYRQTTPLAYVSDSYIQLRAAYPDSVVPISPPVISAQPAGLTVTAGASVTFNGIATGDGTLTYQWCKDGVNLVNGATVSGVTSTTLAIASALVGDAGVYTLVAANEAGSVTSNAAMLTVNKAMVTVTLGGLDGVYTGAPHRATVTTSPGGLAVTFSYDGSGTAPVNAGSYAVVATVSDASFQGLASGTLAIAKAPLTAVADDLRKVPGTANPALTITYTGFVNGETAAVLDAPPTASTTGAADSPAGTYPITVTGGSAKNYALTLQDGILTVSWTPVAGAAGSVVASGFAATWGGMSGATGYRLDVSTDSSFSSFVNGFQDLDIGGATSKVLSGLSPNTTYYYRVRAYNGADTGANSSTITVTTSPTVVITTPLAVSTLAGQPLTNGSSDGTGSAARFYHLTGVAADNAGNLYVADTDNHTIRKIVASTGVVTTFAGAAGISGGADGTGTAARFNNPSGVTVDGAGNVYVADTLNHTLRKVTSIGVVTTLAGSPGVVGSADGTGSAARFQGPQGLAVDSGGNLYVADTNNRTIRKVVSSTGVVTTVAGLAGNSDSADGLGSLARFNFPSGVAVDSEGNLLVADTENHAIRKILPSGSVSTLAGLAGSSGGADGTGSAARFDSPSDVAVDSSGNLYVADTDNHTIRKVVPSTGAVTTLAGLAGTSGIADGLGSAVRFFHPAGIAVDSSSNLYVADTNNHTIRAGMLSVAPAIQTQPQSQTVTVGSNVQFSVTASGRPAVTYQWYFNGAAISGATGNIYSLSSAQPSNAGGYTVVVSNVMGSATSNQATLTVNPVAPPSSGGSGGGGGGGGGAPSPWFCGALLLLVAARTFRRRD
jgi:MBG domain/MBG domain (YGX type)/Immunoglobulin I-set domain/Immunoglobulin domain/NHL repeat/Linear amide C-N hydrolases, choloylglycine hydrolase family